MIKFWRTKSKIHLVNYRSPKPDYSQALAEINSKEYTFSGPCEILIAYSEKEIPSLINKLEKYSYDGKVSVGWISYEGSSVFDPAYPHKPLLFSEMPYACFVVFDNYLCFSDANYFNFCEQGKVNLPNWNPLITREEYINKVLIIRENIGRGNVYQVNFTFPYEAEFEGDLKELFRRLCLAQGKGYFIYLDTPPFAVLSISPELFFHYENNIITVKPMKGTRPRGRWKEEDILLKTELETSEKDRAENLMIVDLLRNDLGKISEFGKVNVNNLFTIEPYKTVWQMTSEIRCETKAGLAEIFRALFPSGSVTGAPKIYAMNLINRLESYPRGVYCGCVGVIFPDMKAIFNVAIRTVLYNYKIRRAYYYVGSGIVWDSEPIKEWEECQVKAHILTKMPESFSLIETIRVEKKTPFLLDYHLKRLEWSAYRFGYLFNVERVRDEVMMICNSVNEPLYRLRLELLPSGKVNFHYPLEIGPNKLRVGLANEFINRDNIFLYHKTSIRDIYNFALLKRPDCQDVILWNEEGYITESTIANVVVVIDGVHYTPPVECGLLPGTYRQYLIDTGKIIEKRIHKEMLPFVDKIYLINSVRKEIDVEWVD